MCNKPYFKTASESLAEKQFHTDQDHAMKLNGAFRLEIESMW